MSTQSTQYYLARIATALESIAHNISPEACCTESIKTGTYKDAHTKDCWKIAQAKFLSTLYKNVRKSRE